MCKTYPAVMSLLSFEKDSPNSTPPLVYIFVGTILLHTRVVQIVCGSIIVAVGVGYVVLEYIPSIEPPDNMRDAGGEWGAEQI